MRKLLTASAALALAATMAHADPGQGKGGGNDHGQAQQKGDNAKPDRAPAAKPNRGPAVKPDRAPGRVAQRDTHGNRPDRPAPAAKRAQKADRPAPPAAKHAEKADRRGPPAKRIQKVERRDVREVVRSNRGTDRDVVRVRDERRGRIVTRVARIDFRDDRGLISGCPPGLAKKRNGCTPPGLLRQRDRAYRYREAYYRPAWWGYGSLGERLFYDDGYLYRVGSNNSVLGYIPLLGGALSVGNVWPSMYAPVSVPPYYVDYYNLGPAGSYRYADDVLYRVNPRTDAITSIAALLTGDDFAIGQPMPLGYDVYNVPYAYRDRYYDGPDALYRYSDGYVYQIDPETRLVAAAIELLI